MDEYSASIPGKRRRRPAFRVAPAYDASLAPNASFSPAATALHPCVLVRTYSGNRNGLVSLLWSLLLSGHPNLRAFVVDTGKAPAPGLPAIVRSVNALSGRTWVEMSRRTFAQDVTPQFTTLAVEDYGYVLTDLVMEDIMGGKARAAGSPAFTDDSPHPLCDTLTVTNGDNVYGPTFLTRTLGPIADHGKEMVGTNWVSHYDFGERWRIGPPAYTHEWCGPHRSGKTQEMKISPVFKCGCIDLGAVVFKLQQVKQSGIRFIVDKLRTNATLGDLEYSDCHFFKRYKALDVKTLTVHEALLMHN